MKLLIIASIIAMINCISAFKINCDYTKNEEWTVLAFIYYCQVTNNVEFSNKGLTSVTGNHVGQSSNDNVLGFWVTHTKMENFPVSLENFFKNLKAIGFQKTGLKTISKDNLQPFGENLIYFSSFDNDIEILEDNLFVHNTNLKVIGLTNNRIKYIADNVFSHLNSLSYLWLFDNSCIDETADNRENTIALVEKTKDKCFVNYMIFMIYSKTVKSH